MDKDDRDTKTNCTNHAFFLLTFPDLNHCFRNDVAYGPKSTPLGQAFRSPRIAPISVVQHVQTNNINLLTEARQAGVQSKACNRLVAWSTCKIEQKLAAMFASGYLLIGQDFLWFDIPAAKHSRAAEHREVKKGHRSLLKRSMVRFYLQYPVFGHFGLMQQ